MQLAVKALLFGASFSAAALDRLLGGGLEFFIPPEIVRHQEVEDAPHVRH